MSGPRRDRVGRQRSGLVGYFGSLRLRFERQDDDGIADEVRSQIVLATTEAITGLERFRTFLFNKVWFVALAMCG